MVSIFKGWLAPKPDEGTERALPPGQVRVRRLQAALFLTALLAFWAFAMLCLSLGENSRNSDEADGLLEARDMAQGNVFLSGWVVNGDSFYTSYVPFGAALIRLFGYSSVVIPVVSFFTYALLVAGALMVAGRRGVSRGSVAVVLFLFLGLLTPFQAWVYFFFNTHTATIAYALFALAALRAGLEAARPGWRIFWFFLFGAILLIAAMGDPFVVYFCILPLLAAGLVVVLRTGGWKIGLAIAGIAIGAVLLSKLGVHFLATRGFTITPVQASLRDYFAPLGRLPTNLRIYQECFQALAGVDVPGWPVFSFGLTVLRLGVGLGAILLTVKLLFSKTVTNRNAYYFDAILLTGILANHAEFLVYSWIFGVGESRYLFPSVVFAAVLAARRFAPALDDGWHRLGWGWRAVFLLPGAAGMLLALGPLWRVSQTRVNEPERTLVRWLLHEDLHSGFAAYWQSNVIRALSAEQVQMAPVYRSVDLKLSPYVFLAKADWFNQPKNFLVYGDETELGTAAVATLGPPNEVHDVAGFQVLIWNHDIHQQLEQPGDVRLRFPLDLTQYALSVSPEMTKSADGSFTDDRPRAQPAILIYGPYLPLPAGRYTARFTLRTADAAPTDQLVLDVAIRHGAEVVGKVKLSGSQLPAGGAEKSYTVTFTSAGPEQSYEFRVWKTGKVKLTIQALTLEKSGS